MFKLKILWLISIPFFILHTVEEYILGFPYQDRFIAEFSNYFQISELSVFFIIQFVLAFTLFLPLFIKSKHNLFWYLFGIILIFELDHTINLLALGNYYPGVITSIPLVYIGLLFWREKLKLVAN